MKESDIRPDNLMLEKTKIKNEEIRKFLLYKSDFVEVVCPGCERTNCEMVFEKTGFTFVECQKCATIFINPRPTPEMLKEYYTNSRIFKFWDEKIYPTSEGIRRTEIFVPRVDKVIQLCRKYNVATKTIMDVGAGFGTFCEEIQKRAVFDKVIAVEPSTSLAQRCKDRGVDVIDKPIEDVSLGGIDVVSNFELIEHLYRPRDFLKACRKTLRSGGLIILTTPNIMGFEMRIAGKLSESFSGPNHLNYFHPKSIKKLFESCGFEVLEVLTPGKLDAELVRKKILSDELDVSQKPFLQMVLVEHWESAGRPFQKFLADYGLSSHMWVVGRKMTAR